MTLGPSEQRVEVEVEVTNAQGLHARPAHQVVVTANQFSAAITVVKDDLEVDAKSIMSLMMLAAEQGSKLLLRAEGEDGGAAIDALAKLFRDGFGEEE